MSRKIAECRTIPGITGCSLIITGEEAEVVSADAGDAVADHGCHAGQELEDSIRKALVDEPNRAILI